MVSLDTLGPARHRSDHSGRYQPQTPKPDPVRFARPVRFAVRFGWVVGPLMLAEIGSAGWMLWSGERAAWFLISLGLVAVNWGSTALVQVPLHGRLEREFTTEAHRVLVRSNWVRTAAWTARGALVAYGLAVGA